MPHLQCNTTVAKYAVPISYCAPRGVVYQRLTYPGCCYVHHSQVVPLAVVATPLRPLPGLVALQYDPVKCRGCACILNPYCHVDFGSHSWACPFWCDPQLYCLCCLSCALCLHLVRALR